jgi:hypothetical protein
MASDTDLTEATQFYSHYVTATELLHYRCIKYMGKNLNFF